jgi:hypothetical protein
VSLEEVPMKLALPAAVAALTLAAGAAGAATIDFENLPPGTTLATQYSGLGVTFTANAFGGAPWAANTDMTIVDSGGSDVGALGTPALVAGNVLRSFSAWLFEDGQASFRMQFELPVTSVSVDFAGVDTPSAVSLVAYDGASLLGSVSGSTQGQFTLAFAAPRITHVAVAPGATFDWVAVDNIVFAPVPEPGRALLLALGAAALALARYSGARGQRALATLGRQGAHPRDADPLTAGTSP